MGNLGFLQGELLDGAAVGFKLKSRAKTVPYNHQLGVC